MKYIFYLSLVLIFVGCKARRVPFSEGGGSFINAVDSSLTKDITVLKFEKSTGIIFPASFGKDILYKDEKVGVSYFTPDTNLIKRVNKEIDYQFYTAKRLAVSTSMENDRKEGKPDSVKVILSKENIAFIDSFTTGRYLAWLKNGAYYDKQFIGYILPNGEKVIKINLLDFREDPKKLRNTFFYAWINGWHGWFYSNTFQLSFNVNQNKLTAYGLL